MAVATRRLVLWPNVGAVGIGRRVARHYLVRRLLRAFATIFLVATVTFWLVRLMPGNPVDVYVNNLVTQGIPYNDARLQAASLYSIDLDEPIWQQYLTYLGQMARGDMGSSIIQGASVRSIILTYLPWTLFSVGVGLAISFSLGALLGILIAYKRESPLDHVLTNLGSIVHAVPNYVTAIALVVFLGVRWRWIDIAAMRGTHSANVDSGLHFAFIRDVFYHAALPIAVYVLTSVGGWMLAMRASTESTLGEDYVTVAHARGLREHRIALAYVGRNAVLPLFTQLMIAVAFSVGGSLLIETIFSYQGLGLTLSTAIAQRDYPVIQGILLVITSSVVLINLLSDLLYARLDPRVRTPGRGG